MRAQIDTLSTPAGVAEEPRPSQPGRLHRSAVGWLFGPDMIAQLKKMTGRRHDPRRWMPFRRGFAHDECVFCDGRMIKVDDSGDRLRVLRPEAGVGHDQAQAPVSVAAPSLQNEILDAPSPQEDIWFDYIADIGDSTDAMYAIAYACQADLELTVNGDGALPVIWPLEDANVHVWRGTAHDARRRRGNLQRGQFLFIGGDTGYHVGDSVTLRTRVQAPFDWAFADLGDDLARSEETPRLYGIPGNHDWYDNLDGFSQLFCRGAHPEAIHLKGFARAQRASYVGLQLPFGWQLWGLDIDQGMDAGQREYFRHLLPGGKPSETSSESRDPERLILCTPSPPIAFGRVTAAREHEDVLRVLHLTPAHRKERALAPGKQRLDLSGDTHHYARYASTNPNTSADSYQCVISGLGGAFLHPTFTRAGTHRAAVEYPSEESSLKELASELLHARTVIAGSWIRAVPIFLAILLGYASTSAGAAGWMLGSLLSALPGMRKQEAVGAAEVPKVLLLTLVMILAGSFARVAIKLFQMTTLAHLKEPWRKRNIFQARWGFGRGEKFDVLRSYTATTIFAIGAGLAPISLIPCAHACPSAKTAVLDLASLLVFAVGLFLAPALGCLYGAKHLPAAAKVRLFPIALLQGIGLIVTPLLCARLVMVGPATQIVAVAVILANMMLIWLSRIPFRKRRIAPIVLCWLFAWLGGMAALIGASKGETVPYVGLVETFLQFGAGGLVAFVLVMLHFTWYLAIAGLMNAHNNEIGGAARVTKFRQLIRFHIDRSGLTGYVIAVEHEGGSPVDAKGTNLKFALRDIIRLPHPNMQSFRTSTA